MDARAAIKLGLEASAMLSLDLLKDLNDQEMMQRPCAGCNHVNWQVGHLVLSENELLNKALPGSVPPLPSGFAEKYSRDTVSSDDAGQFCSKAELIQEFEKQRAATLAALDRQSDEDLDQPTGVDWAPTVGAMLSMQGAHWLMHSGQWTVVRRQLGRKPLF